MSGPLLTEIRLERFKAAFKPDPISLRSFNVIIGRNGSGKSTLLEALQWLDTALRHDTRRASDRYSGIRDLINLRSRMQPQYFELGLCWHDGESDDWAYNVVVVDDEGLAKVEREFLAHGSDVYIEPRGGGLRLLVDPSGRPVEVREPERLALGRVVDVPETTSRSPAFLRDFWQRAVFLRLSPSDLARGSPAKRASYEPLLDEGGETLPALLNELDEEQREALVEAVQEVLPSFRGLEVSEASGGRDVRVHYSLLETMPYRGRAGRSKFPIPAWMLSEGTRRITAILALLQREPPPSLLCIEEVENGLDPWTVQAVLGHLQQAARRGIQVVVTTHSPWLLDHVPIDSIIQVRRKDGDTIYERFAERPEVQAYDPRVPAGTRYVNEAE
ncbi:AAA family ATPase [Paraliomyxa miuraensis]|uniref:AAA family ATPase n=1 Tax=Paraliomyxa miuraensis TaxID=376150 RepID=UPI0022502152|nr:ATP-binding protein [Paraliomyxa miuraensis]MCX4246222.1 AAA family ATPase [Paraliomyxa miuraensis]